MKVFRCIHFAAIFLGCVLLRKAAAQDSSVCSASNPCESGCCSKEGNCGFGPSFCGKGNCTSNCDAQAECGRYAPSGKEHCPLNVCCSEFGFCGTTSQFCEKGCQNGCEKPTRPACGTSTPKRIGYYQSWNVNHPCDRVTPESIESGLWTHLNYAFALIDPKTFQIAPMNDFDRKAWSQFTSLKMQSPGLKVYISIGGWDAGGRVFSDMVSTTERRSAFINSAMRFCATYGFDGIDIDWEYPAASDRGGREADFKNYVQFLKELKLSFGLRGVTVTIPSSYWYLKGFDLEAMEPHVDWFNLMSYDIHGTWDGTDPWTRKVVNPHTNLTEIQDSLDLLWRNKVSPSKVVMGLGFYGRSFTLTDPSCKKPGCPFSGGAKPGNCSGQAGILSNAEIMRLINDKDLKPVMDEKAAVKWISWDNDQWVSYDDADTFAIKNDFVQKNCLGGTMVWALDQDSANSQSAQYLASHGTMNNSKAFQMEKAVANQKQHHIERVAVWTPCLKDSDLTCPPGFHNNGIVGHGNVFDFDSYREIEGCHGKLNRALCIANGIVDVKCQWHRQANGGKFCDSSCPAGTYFLTQNSHPAGDRSGCAHGTFISVCCENIITAFDVCPSSMIDNLFGGGFTGNGGVDAEWVWGETPSHTRREAQGIESSNADNVTDKIDADNSGEAANEPMKSTEDDSSAGLKWLARRGVADSNSIGLCLPQHSIAPPPLPNFPVVWLGQAFNPDVGKGSVWGTATPGNNFRRTILPDITTAVADPIIKDCDFALYPQACAHYSSAGQNDPYAYAPICPLVDEGWNTRLEPLIWGQNHHDKWWKNPRWIARDYVNPQGVRTRLECQRDEWPPLAVMRWQRQFFNQYIRLNPAEQNRDAGQIWNPFCEYPVRSSTSTSTVRIDVNGLDFTTWVQKHSTLSRNQLALRYLNNPHSDLLQENPCWPHVLAPDAEKGFALNIDDPFYRGHIDQYKYGFPPLEAVTANKQPLRKRDKDIFDKEELIFNVNEGNTSRRATPEEVEERYDVLDCESEGCVEELAQARKDFDLATSAWVARMPLQSAFDQSSASGEKDTLTQSHVTMTLSVTGAMTGASPAQITTKPTASVISEWEEGHSRS